MQTKRFFALAMTDAILGELEPSAQQFRKKIAQHRSVAQ
jgi:hypothetical protein